MKRPALRYHGAKFRIADWVIGFFPPHRVYTEVFGGAAGVLLQKPRAYAEVYNDLDGDVVNFFRVLRDPLLALELERLCSLTPFARAEFEAAWVPGGSPVERARKLAIRAQMGFGSAGATKGTTGFRSDTGRLYGTSQQDWSGYPARLSHVSARLTGVLVECLPAIEVLLAHDAPDTLHFVDPPYVHSTRIRGAGKDRSYRHEMTDAQHAELLRVLLGLRGMVVLTGYASDLYSSALGAWALHQRNSRISAGRGGGSRIECAWLNPACASRMRQRPLF